MKLSKRMRVGILSTFSIFIFGVGTAFAWQTSQSADSYCKDAHAYINASFSNTEQKQDKYSMDVYVKDIQTGKTTSTVTISPGKSHTWNINSGEDELSNGKVEFYLTWSEGHPGIDKRSANYASTGKCSPEPKPTSEPNPKPQPNPEPEPSPESETWPQPELPPNHDLEPAPTPELQPTPEPQPSPEPKSEKKNKDVSISKMVRFEGQDTWKEKIIGVELDDVIEFRIKIDNKGNTEIDNLKMIDDLPDELERIGGSGLTESFDNLAEDDDKSFTIKAKVKDEYMNEEKCVVNEAKVERDGKEKDRDTATVCFGEVELSELPETGPTETGAIALSGILMLGLGLKFRKSLVR